jgi:DNA-binding beta-propeller fold protein YncE
MRRTLLISALISLTLSSFGQYLDYMGMPTNIEIKNQTQMTNNRTTDLEEAEIVNVIPSPAQYTADITFDGELLWVNGYNEYQLFGIDPITGDVVETLAISIQRPYGMTYKNGAFYIIDNNAKEIVVIDRYTGETIETKVLPQENTYPTGLEIIDDAFYYNDPTSPYAAVEGDLTRKFNCTDTCYVDYTAVGDFPSGLAFDGDYLWSTDNVTQILHQVNKLTLEPVRTIQAPGGIYPNGLTSNGEFLWISNNDADSIYQIRINEPTVSTGIVSLENENQLNIFPTVASEKINIQFQSEFNEDYSIEIVALNGQIIEKFEAESNFENITSWDINQNMSSGIYFCRINSSKGIISKKFIVSR